MLVRKAARRAHSVFGCLALLLLLARCGGSAAEGDAGAGGVIAQSGAASTLAGAGAGGAVSVAGSAGDVSSAGLGGDAGSSAGAPESGAGGVPMGEAGSGSCAVELATFGAPTAQHVTECSTIAYPMNPPVYGDHYPVWAAYRTYTFAVPLGYLVHDLEHGAVLYLYNCPEGCADEVARVQAIIDGLPLDPRCAPEVKHQVILSPDPTLPTRWAAAAWGHSLRADCVDTQAFRAFYDANFAHGTEDICGDGLAFTSDPCVQ